MKYYENILLITIAILKVSNVGYINGRNPTHMSLWILGIPGVICIAYIEMIINTSYTYVCMLYHIYTYIHSICCRT